MENLATNLEKFIIGFHRYKFGLCPKLLSHHYSSDSHRNYLHNLFPRYN